MTDDGSIPTTDEKPVCPCGGIVLIDSHSENGLDFWRCIMCGHAMVTRRPIKPFKSIRWRKVPAGRQ